MAPHRNEAISSPGHGHGHPPRSRRSAHRLAAVLVVGTGATEELELGGCIASVCAGAEIHQNQGPRESLGLQVPSEVVFRVGLVGPVIPSEEVRLEP